MKTCRALYQNGAWQRGKAGGFGFFGSFIKIAPENPVFVDGDERCICWKQKKTDQMLKHQMLKRVDAETSSA